MRKTLKNTIERGGLRILAAVALTGSLAAFGCTTNRTPGYGEPGMSTPAAGSVAPNATSTPGSANTMGSMPLGPQASSPANGESASVDAIADLKADEAYRGKLLGPAAPGDNSVTPVSMQQTTGQFISPSLYANPQVTVNSSISSAPTPAIVSGAAGDSGVTVVGGAATLPATVGGSTLGTTGTIATGAITNNAALNGAQNVGVTGVSSATATPITNGTTANAALTPAGTATVVNPALATNNQVIGTGMANAPAPASNVTATPILTAVGPLGQAGSVLGVTNVAPANAAAKPTVSNTTATGVTAGSMASNVRVLNTMVATPVTANAATVKSGALTARTRAAASSGTGTSTAATAGLRVVTAPNGAVVVTNQSQSALQRFMSVLGFRHSSTMPGTSGSQNP